MWHRVTPDTWFHSGHGSSFRGIHSVFIRKEWMAAWVVLSGERGTGTSSRIVGVRVVVV